VSRPGTATKAHAGHMHRVAHQIQLNMKLQCQKAISLNCESKVYSSERVRVHVLLRVHKAADCLLSLPGVQTNQSVNMCTECTKQPVGTLNYW